jgi:hypothetical protein
MIASNWDVDLERMTCKNRVSRIRVRFMDNGAWLDGCIEDVPLTLLSVLARTRDGAAYLGRQLREAEGVFIPEFLRAMNRD